MYLGYISAISRLYLGYISAIPRLYLGYISAISCLVAAMRVVQHELAQPRARNARANVAPCGRGGLRRELEGTGLLKRERQRYL